MTPAQLADELARIDKLGRLAKRAAARFHETPHYADLRNGSLMHDEVPDAMPSGWWILPLALIGLGVIAAIIKAVMWWI